jgi:hypothetical protein
MPLVLTLQPCLYSYSSNALIFSTVNSQEDFGEKEYIDNANLPYHSPHKFGHGHIQYGASHAKGVTDLKAVSMNVMQASMIITDEFYLYLNDGEVKNRISGLDEQEHSKENNELEQYSNI